MPASLTAISTSVRAVSSSPVEAKATRWVPICDPSRTTRKRYSPGSAAAGRASGGTARGGKERRPSMSALAPQGGPAAVHADHLAGDPAGGVRQEEVGQRRGVLAFAEARDGVQLGDGVGHLRAL